jgi:Xaa-Pro dipeptidase
VSQQPSSVSIVLDEPPPAPIGAELDEAIRQRRADIDAKQAAVARILTEMECEGALLFMPAHVAWFTDGLNVRGLIAESERPGIFTNGRQRWLVCSNVDSQRLFDEELDLLGFQLKEWSWLTGRAVMLGELVANKKIAADRPFPNLPMLNDRLRVDLRQLSPIDKQKYASLGQLVTHALEATARTFKRGESEEEIAGHVAHRIVHRGAEVVGISITADDRGQRFRRTGYTSARVEKHCIIQATGSRDGLYVTASRSVVFGSQNAELKSAYDTLAKYSTVQRAYSRIGETMITVSDKARRVLSNTPYEFEWRDSQPGYGAGWFPAEELRRQGIDEVFLANQPIIWQARLGSAAILDTVLIGEQGAEAITPPLNWPFKKVKIDNRAFDIPDLLQRDE